MARKGRIQNVSDISDQLDAQSQEGWGGTGVGKFMTSVADVENGDRWVRLPRADGRWMSEPGALGTGLW